MKRKEAIQILSTRDAHGVLCGYTSGVTEALDMAIEALQKDIERHERVIRASERYLGIVRCKDCKHYNIPIGEDGWIVCPMNIEEQPNAFCSRGERREE